MTTQSLSSPNRIVWDYFFSLRQLAAQSRTAESTDLVRQSAALAVVMGVTAVEVFLNLWFRVRVDEKGSSGDRDALLEDFRRRKSLEHKLKDWPKRFLGHSVEYSRGPGLEFQKLKALRNSIIHFTSSHETVELDVAVFIHGLADTSEYDSLGEREASWALKTAEGMVAEVFFAAGLSTEEIPHALHAWAGKTPV